MYIRLRHYRITFGEKEEAQKIRNMGVISVEENGDKATLKYTNQDGKIEEAQMVKEDGKWKIDR